MGALLQDYGTPFSVGIRDSMLALCNSSVISYVTYW